MKNHKIRFKIFTVPEYEKEQEYLHKQHKAGWKFTWVVFPGIYSFEKCEPEDVVYQLDYNQEGISHKDEYVKMFEDCGWEHVLDCFGYSYFRKSVKNMKGEEEIFCDAASKLDMANRVFKGRMIPLLVIFLGCICPQLYVQFAFKTSINKILFYSYLLMFILYVLIFAWFGLQYWKLYRKINKSR